MNIQNKPICQLSDSDISELLTGCAGMFGTILRKEVLDPFIYFLRSKFNLTTDKQIIEAVSNYVGGNTQENIARFSAALLSAIIKGADKEKFPTYEVYEKKVVSESDREKYKRMWLDAVYQDYEDFCRRIEPSRIHVWMYLADELQNAGLVTKAEKDIAGDSSQRRNPETFKTIFANGYKNLCLEKFKDMAMKSEHISQYLN